MTVIVTDGQAMAADSRVTNIHTGGIITDAAQKLFRTPSGAIVGWAGDSGVATVVRDWFERGEDRDSFPARIGEEFECLILRPDGRVEWMDYRFAPFEWAAPAAIGCGRDLALGALAIGADLEWAVRVAIERNSHCGGNVRLLKPGKEADGHPETNPAEDRGPDSGPAERPHP